MTKHTAGPYWRDDDGFIAAGSGDTYVTLADCDCTHDIDICEREANKQLFIAAPDMLATLRAIANDCEDYLNDDLDMDAGELCQAFLNAINQVHDKATGSMFASDKPVDADGEAVPQ